MKLSKLIEDYYSSYEYRQLRDETKVQYKYFLNVMKNTQAEGKSLCQYNVEKITTKMAKTAYNEWCEKGISMANHIISTTRIVFNHGLREELCLINPFANVRRRTAERRKAIWSRDDVQKLLSVAYSDFSTRNIGLIAHINFVEQTVHIEQSKRRAEVFLPIEDDLFSMLVQQHEDFGFQTYVAPRPYAIKGEYRPYTLHKLPLFGRELMERAGISRELRLSDLRRTSTTEMVEAGVGIGQIMSVTGHANPQSVKPYIKNTLKSADYALTQRKIHDKSITSAAKESD